MLQITVDDDYTRQSFRFNNRVHTEGNEGEMTWSNFSNDTYSGRLCYGDLFSAIQALISLPLQGLLSIRFFGDGKVELNGNLKVLGNEHLLLVEFGVSEIKNRATRLAILYRANPTILHATYTLTVKQKDEEDDKEE